MPKAVSKLESLPPEAQDKVLAWLEVESRPVVLDRIAKPEPEGFGLHTCLTSLARFHTRHRLKEREEDLALAKEIAPGDSANPIDSATKSLAQDWAFHLATKPERDVNDFKALARWLLRRRENEQRDRELDLFEQRLAFDRERYEFDITRAIIEHLPSLNEIVNEDKSEHEDKINRARSLIFKRPISELPPRILPASRREMPDLNDK